MTSSCAAMTWRECLNLSDLSEDELADLVTRGFDFDLEGADLEHYLIITPEGRLSVRSALSSDIREAVANGDVHRSGTLKQVLLHFMQLYSARTA